MLYIFTKISHKFQIAQIVVIILQKSFPAFQLQQLLVKKKKKKKKEEEEDNVKMFSLTVTV